MVTHKLYANAFDENVLTSATPQAQRRQARQGVLQDIPQVRAIATEPGTRQLTGDFSGQYAELMAVEMQELIAAPNIDTVPYFVTGEARDWQGYYAPSEFREGDRRDPRLAGVHRFDGRLTLEGTRRSHLRSVRVTPTTETNPFGSASTEQVWLHGRASDVRWVSNEEDTVESATVQATQPAEHSIDVDRYDVTEPSFSGTDDTYTLVYDLPYAREWEADPRVWDTYGNAKEALSSYSGDTVGTDTHVGTATVGDERRVSPAWARVFSSSHDYVGERVIENGRLRLEPRPGESVLRAYQWDDADSIYAIVQLGNTDWRLQEWDVTRIGLERVVSRTKWQDTGGSSTFELVCEVVRGNDTAVFYEPENVTGSTPADLVTRLNPIAHDSDQVLGEGAGIFERSSVPDE